MRARTLGIVAAAGLASLVSGCSDIERQETKEGYTLTYEVDSGWPPFFTEHTYASFVHNNLYNFDTLSWTKISDATVIESVDFTDYNCDGLVDLFCNEYGCFRRDEMDEGCELKQIDKDFANYKKKLGAQ